MMSTFHADLDRGIQIEKKVLDILKNDYPSATIINGYKGYDIWIPEISKSLEIKYDPMSNQTGNIVVEIEMSGKSSALLTTTADFWIFYDNKSFMIITPMKIVECIFKERLLYANFTGNGDKNSKKAFLVKKKVLARYAKRVVEVDNEPNS